MGEAQEHQLNIAREINNDLPGIDQLRENYANSHKISQQLLCIEGDECATAEDQPSGQELDKKIRQLTAENRASASTRHEKAGEWLRKQQGDLTSKTAVQTEQEVQLFARLLFDRNGFMPRRGKPDFGKMCTAWNEEVYTLVLARERECACCSLALTPAAGGAATNFTNTGTATTFEGCTSCRTGSGISLKTPELLKAYYELLGKRLAVTNAMEPDLEAWRNLQRDHNAAAPPTRFAEPSAQPTAPEPADANAVAGELASHLPTQLGPPLAGVTASLSARETKPAAQRRWRTAAIIALLEGAVPVQATNLLVETGKLRTAEAVFRGVDITTMHELQSQGALRKWLSLNKTEWQAYTITGRDVTGLEIAGSNGGGAAGDDG